MNSAAVDFGIDGTAHSAKSNNATLVTDEVLDIGLSRTGSGAIVVRPAIVAAVPFVLTNAGNGSEAFTLAGAINGLSASVTGFAVDRNGDGTYDPAVDSAITPGTATPALDPGASLQLFALVEADAPAGDGILEIRSHAVTGSSVPGTVFVGRGDGGADAIVGATTAAAAISVPLAAGTDSTSVVLDKSQIILASDGSSNAVHGATVTYTIAAHFAGQGHVRGSVLSDPIPDGTDYVPGSLRLDGLALSDAVDGDAGSADAAGTGVSVMLGDVAAPALRTVRFQVTIK